MEELSPIEIFNQFSEAMYIWNLNAIKMKEDNIPHDIRVKKMQEDLEVIFEKYVTTRKRTYTRANFGNPPEYNPETNEVISTLIEEKKAYIEVQEKVSLKRKLRYTLQKKKEGWKVDKRESYSKSSDKWDIRTL